MEISYGTLYGKPTLVKTVQKPSNPRMLQKFTQYAKLRHRNVGVVYGVCLPPDPCCILVEHVRGCSLQVLLASPEVQVRERDRNALALAIATGMEYLHGAGVAHRLLCPLFVMVEDGTGVCKIVHHGLYVLASEMHSIPPFLVDQMFVAPEVLRGDDADGSLDLAKAADVYSYGVILYALEMAMAASSSSAAVISSSSSSSVTPSQLAQQSSSRNLPALEVPKHCDYYYGRLMKKCLSSKPYKRPSFSKIVAELTKMMAK